MCNQLLYHTLATPLGTLKLVANDHAIVLASFLDSGVSLSDDAEISLPTALRNTRSLLRKYERRTHRVESAGEIIEHAATSIDRYFGGELMGLNSVPVQLYGTEFQQLVWNTLRTIPPGETYTYSKLAGAIQRARAVRASGTACKHNPIVLFVPCHRVIGKDGSLTGFNAGLERKAALLKHEGLGVGLSKQYSVSKAFAPAALSF